MRDAKRVNLDEQIDIGNNSYWVNGEAYVYGDLIENYSGGDFSGAHTLDTSYEFEPSGEVELLVEFNMVDDNESPVTDDYIVSQLKNKATELALNYVDFSDELM